MYNEVMKNKVIIISLVTFFVCLLFLGCASNDSIKGNSPKELESQPALFADWKYKGFGHPLPAWFEAAYKNDVSGIKKSASNLLDSEIVILKGEGINSDQAEKVLKIRQEEISDYFLFYDSCWSRIGAGQYVALAVLYK